MRRRAFYTNESYARQTAVGIRYHVADVEEGEPGYRPVGHFDTLDEARAYADRHNERLGLREQDVLEIVLSSMRLSRIGESP